MNLYAVFSAVGGVRLLLALFRFKGDAERFAATQFAHVEEVAGF